MGIYVSIGSLVVYMLFVYLFIIRKSKSKTKPLSPAQGSPAKQTGAIYHNSDSNHPSKQALKEKLIHTYRAIRDVEQQSSLDTTEQKLTHKEAVSDKSPVTNEDVKTSKQSVIEWITDNEIELKQ